MSDDYAGPGVPTFGPPIVNCPTCGGSGKVTKDDAARPTPDVERLRSVVERLMNPSPPHTGYWDGFENCRSAILAALAASPEAASHE